MSMLIQIFIFLFLIVLVSGLVAKAALRGKMALWLMAGYVAVLFISVLLFLPIAEQRETAGEGLDTRTVDQEGEQLQEAAQTGNLNETYLHERWSFDYGEDEIQVEASDNGGLSIYIEEKEENDNSVEAAYYQVPSTVEGQGVQNPNPLALDLEGDTLAIGEPESLEVEYNVFDEPFPFHQFSDEETMFAIQQGRTLLYLRVPANLNVDTVENVTYVDEDVG